jgi:hypothetical protein
VPGAVPSIQTGTFCSPVELPAASLARYDSACLPSPLTGTGDTYGCQPADSPVSTARAPPRLSTALIATVASPRYQPLSPGAAALVTEAEASGASESSGTGRTQLSAIDGS